MKELNWEAKCPLCSSGSHPGTRPQGRMLISMEGAWWLRLRPRVTPTAQTSMWVHHSAGPQAGGVIWVVHCVGRRGPQEDWNQHNICSIANSVWFVVEKRNLSKGKAFCQPVSLGSYPHLWTWIVGSDQKNGIANLKGWAESALPGWRLPDLGKMGFKTTFCLWLTSQNRLSTSLSHENSRGLWFV